MNRGYPFVSRGGILFLFLIFMGGAAGCGDAVNNTPVPFCTPESTQVNIYRVPPQSWAGMIFEYAYPTLPTAIPPAPPAIIQPNEGMILQARYAAFQQLIKETERWSDTETLTLDDQSKVRITLTFISPELIQAVFLSDVLKDRFLTSGFQDQLQNALNGIADRDELLFLLTVTPVNSGNINPIRHRIKIPISDMLLNNAENLSVRRAHADRNLEQVIDTTEEPVFGYLGYPLAMLSGPQCKWILDPRYNTNIVVTVPTIEVDGIGTGEHSWTIPYTSLIAPVLPPALPDFNIPPGFDTNLMMPQDSPPAELNLPDYWQNFARFIWSQLTLGKY